MKDSKILIGIIVATLILLVGGVFLLSRTSTDSQVLTEVVGIETEPASYNLGDVPIQGGIVSKEYTIRNTTDKAIKLKKVATSCMCTTASVEVGDKVTKFFGMEGHGDANPPVNLEIAPGASGKVVVKFDPAAHGPEGVGPFDRIVWLTFSDPAGVKELSFQGNVTP